jgi:hypothetical protein
MELRLPSRRVLAALYVASGVIAGGLSYGLGQSRNLEVYRHASRALLAGRDLYDGSSVDWFKYSPTFALFFLPLALAPAWLASVVWGAINFGVAFLGLDAAAGSDRRARIALLAALPGVLLSTDGDQANLLVAGAMLFAFASFVRGRSMVGALVVASAALVKLFPIAGALFVFLQADRREHERSMFRIILALSLGLALPLVVLWQHPSALFRQFESWMALVRADHATRGWSLVTVAHDSFGVSGWTVQILAALTLLVPVVGCLRGGGGGGGGGGRSAGSEPRFRRAFAATVLVLIVMCNHRSEYTSFVISALGVGLWFADGPISSPWRLALLVFASVAHGPVMLWRDHVNQLEGTPLWFLGAHRDFHAVRLAPLFFVWCTLQVDLLRHVFLAPSSRDADVSSAAAE